MKHLHHGFTLIELLLVIALMLLLGTMGTAFTSRFLTQNGVTNAQDQLVGDLRKAQMNAMMGKQRTNVTCNPCNWGVNYGGTANTITLYLGNTFAGRNSAFDEKFSVNASISITGVTDVNFAKVTGLPNTTGTMTITGNGQTKTVTINSQGMVTR